MASEKSGASYRWLVIALLVAAGVYVWYAVAQYGRLNDLNQRQLSNAAAELRTTLANALETVTRFGTKWGKDGVISGPSLCGFVQDQPYLDLEQGSCAETASLPAQIFETSHVLTDPILGIETGPLRFRFLTDRLLQELAFPDAFGLIFIADADGKVLYQAAPTQRRWLRHLRWGEQTFRDAHADRPPTLQIQDVREVLGGEEPWKKLKSISSRTSLQFGGTWHQVYLQPLVLENGKSKGLIVGGVVPTRVVVRDALALDTYLVAVLVFLLLLGVLGFPFLKLGFLDLHERFRLRDVNLLYLSTGALLVLFICAVLAIDGYKRWQATANQGLEAFTGDLERRFLGEVAAIRNQIEVYDHQLAAMAATDCEQWKTVDTKWFAGKKPAPDRSERPILDWPKGPIHLRLIAWIGEDGVQRWKSTADAIPGKSPVGERTYFRAVRDGGLFQIAGHGKAIFLGPDRSIANGKFYTFISMRSQLADESIADEGEGASRPPVCDALKGTTTVMASAQLLSLDRQPLPAGYGFVVVNREGRVLYHSDRRLSLRENFFDELSQAGRARAVIYAGASDAIESRYRERPHAFYFHPIRLNRAGEEEGAGLYIIGFRETSAERALVAHVFVTGLAGPMLLLLVIYAAGLGGIALVSRYGGRHWSSWLWPHGGLTSTYRWQTITFFVLLLGSIALYFTSRHIEVFLVAPVLAAAAGSAICVFGNHASGPRRRLSAPVWHTAALVLVLGCMIVAPSTALFRLALSQEFAKLILTERQWIHGQKADAVRATEVDALAEHYGRAWNQEHRAVRWGSFACLPAPFDAELPPGQIEPRDGPEPGVLRAAYWEGEAEPAMSTSTARPSEAVDCTPFRASSHASSDSTATDSDRSSRSASQRATLREIGMGMGIVRALHWFDNVLPPNEILARQRFTRFQGDGIEYGYSPDGTILKQLRVSLVLLLFLPVMLVLLVWWIRWNTNRLFFANEHVDVPVPAGPFDEIWNPLENEQKLALLQIARERIANPYQRKIVKGFLDNGLLRLNPELQPCSEEFRRFLEDKDRQLGNDLQSWEHVDLGHSWRYVRLILVASLVGLAFFLIATQPGLQSSLLALAGGITTALTTGVKLRDAVGSWFGSKAS
jgi:hypothetical protein